VVSRIRREYRRPVEISETGWVERDVPDGRWALRFAMQDGFTRAFRRLD
jgi:hypothetical protein